MLLLDKNQKIRYYDENYAAQGEKLKPLEESVKKVLAIKPDFEKINQVSPLNIGAKAIDFHIGNDSKLSDYFGKKIVLISFYPAAFSGELALKSVINKHEQDFMGFIKSPDLPIITCAAQIKEIASISIGLPNILQSNIRKKAFIDSTAQNIHLKFPKNTSVGKIGTNRENFNSPIATLPTLKKTVQPTGKIDSTKFEVITITSSELILLNLWEKLLETKNITYVNDKNYHIAQNYHSYNEALGYNRRTLFIVDLEGNIAYIDWNYGDSTSDLQHVQNELATLLRK